MQESDRIQFPVLEVSIGGSVISRRPSAFDLVTDSGFPSVMARISYPADVSSGKKGDEIAVSLAVDGEKNLLFTGEVYDAKVRGAYRELALTDGYKRLWDTTVTPAYRKEKASVILQDALDAAGISSSSITCPSVELARFSSPSASVSACISLLIKALEEHGHPGLRYFFDAKNVFRFGTVDDTGVNEGSTVSLKTGRNILQKGAGWVEVLPVAIRHSQMITIDGTKVLPYRTELHISRERSRLMLWVKAAA